MPDTDTTLLPLLQRINPQASQVERHLWLAELLQWVRGDQHNVQDAVRRIRSLISWLQGHPEWLQIWQRWLEAFTAHIDAVPLLADYGFAPRTAFVSELGHRLVRKWLPSSPDTSDLSKLLNVLFPTAFDAQWIRALDPSTIGTLAHLLVSQAKPPEAATLTSHADIAVVQTTSSAWSQPEMGYWHKALMEAIVVCVSQIGAAGFASEIRMRMSHDEATINAFHNLHYCLDDWTRQVSIYGLAHPESVAASETLRSQLALCRQAANTVYQHLDAEGISIDIVFRLRQLRDRILRVNELLDCLYSAQPAHATARLVARLIMVGRARRSVRELVVTSSHLTASKMAERHAETGEHYITRNASEWFKLFGCALGGGTAMGVAVWLKFLIISLGLSIFWNGFAAGVNYASIFVIVQLVHWTIATKQPAVTAPALAAKLKAMDQPNAIDHFMDEVAHLIRSQFIAITGNLLTVAPMAYGISVLLEMYTGSPMIEPRLAQYVQSNLSILSPTIVLAMLTGVLLFASSQIAGWFENWFVFHKLDSAIRYSRRLTRWLGSQRTHRLSHWLRDNVSGLAANISLGMMLGLVPAFLQFFGLPVDVRHVTLAAGQLAVSVHTLGVESLSSAEFWLALAGVATIGPINVAVSFWLAFRTALVAQNLPRLDRRRIRSALLYRLRHSPWDFILPPSTRKAKQ